MSSKDIIADAILAIFQSTNELDANGEAANIVDVLASLARGVHRIADVLCDDFNDRRGR